MMKIKKRYIGLVVVTGIILANGTLNNFRVVTTTYDLSSSKIREDYTFVQISDFHSNSKTDKILEQTAANNPDYILLTGDILESADMSSTLAFVDQLTQIATVIYIRGNHEDDYKSYNQFKTELEKLGVVMLADGSYQVDDLNFIGIEDWSGANLMKSDYFTSEYTNYINLYKDQVDTSKYNILLAHRPNFLDAYSELGVDLVLSGHAHGGQWQIPFTDIGIIAPDEGLFPTHVHGLKTVDNTNQVISSGNSNPYGPWIPRLFNPEEVVVVNLTPSS